MDVETHRDGPVTVIEIARPARRNAVDAATAAALAAAFRAFDADADAAAAVLHGRGGTFCAGADLMAVAAGHPNRLEAEGDAPLGVSRLELSKPVVAAIEGHAVAGGLELALWCDLRVAAASAVLGVFCRRFGVPLIDGGTVRLPRLIGESRALDMILTGREVRAEEALAWGLVNRVVPDGTARDAAVALAHDLAALPPACLRSDRASARGQWGLPLAAALRREFELGLATIESGETAAGAAAFAGGAGRHGEPRG